MVPGVLNCQTAWLHLGMTDCSVIKTYIDLTRNHAVQMRSSTISDRKSSTCGSICMFRQAGLTALWCIQKHKLCRYYLVGPDRRAAILINEHRQCWPHPLEPSEALRNSMGNLPNMRQEGLLRMRN